MRVRARSPTARPSFNIRRVPGVASGRPQARPGPVRVLAVDDTDVFRRAIRTLLRADPRLELVGEANSGEHALEIASSCDPHLVLMDVRMPGMGGLAATKQIKAKHPSTIVVLISTEHPSELPAEASTCGADALVWKSDLRPRALEAIWLKH